MKTVFVQSAMWRFRPKSFLYFPSPPFRFRKVMWLGCCCVCSCARFRRGNVKFPYICEDLLYERYVVQATLWLYFLVLWLKISESHPLPPPKFADPTNRGALIPTAKCIWFTFRNVALYALPYLTASILNCAWEQSFSPVIIRSISKGNYAQFRTWSGRNKRFLFPFRNRL